MIQKIQQILNRLRRMKKRIILKMKKMMKPRFNFFFFEDWNGSIYSNNNTNITKDFSFFYYFDFTQIFYD